MSDVMSRKYKQDLDTQAWSYVQYDISKHK